MVDLKGQYQGIKEQVNNGIASVLESSAFINGPEVHAFQKELEDYAGQLKVTFDSSDNDSKRIFWSDGGVHQNMTHAVHPDPHSGMHCWHQRVRIEQPHPGDKYGDIFVDTNKSHEMYKEWMAMTRPAPGPNGLRRPL